MAFITRRPNRVAYDVPSLLWCAYLLGISTSMQRFSCTNSRCCLYSLRRAMGNTHAYMPTPKLVSTQGGRPCSITFRHAGRQASSESKQRQEYIHMHNLDELPYNPTALSQTFCCHPNNIGNISVNPNSGQYVLTKCNCVSSAAFFVSLLASAVLYSPATFGNH